MKKAFLLLLLFSHIGLSQSTPQTISSIKKEKGVLPDTYDGPKNIIKFTPLKMFGSYHPSYEFGYERIINNDFSVQVNAGKTINRWFDNSNEKYMRGITLSIEPRMYLNTKHNFYFSFEGGVIAKNMKTDWRITRVDSVDSYGYNVTSTYLDTFNVKYRQFYFAPKIGWVKDLGNNLTFETYVGLGVANINTTHQNRKNTNDYIEVGDLLYVLSDTFTSEFSESRLVNQVREKTVTRTKLLFNFRIGYAF